MRFLPQSYADFVSVCKLLDSAPKVVYFPYAAVATQLAQHIECSADFE